MKNFFCSLLFVPIALFGQEWTQLHNNTCLNVITDGNGIHYSLNDNSVTKSFDGGLTWEFTNFPQNSEFGAIAIDSILFISSPHNDLFSSINQGETWESSFAGGGGCAAVRMIYMENPNEILMSYTGYLRGIYKSNNYSSNITWENRFNPTGADCWDMCLSEDKNIVYSAFRSSNHIGGLYQSNDFGESWELLLQTEYAENPSVLEVSDSHIYYVSVDNKFYKSADEGITWTNPHLFTDVNGQIAPNYSCKDMVRIGSTLIASFNNIGLFMSSDDGDTWEKIDGLNENQLNYMLISDNKLYVSSQSGLYSTLIGCTDETAFNYNSEANVEDGSCYPVIEGCMSSIAENYITPIGNLQIDVNTDDGSCLFSAQVFDDIVTTNSNLEEELSVYETVQEEQDYSMSFDGEDGLQFIDLPAQMISHQDPRTIMVKVYPENNNFLFSSFNSSTGEYRLETHQFALKGSDSQWYYSGVSESDEDAMAQHLNDWLLVTGVWDNENIYFYHDSILVQQTTLSGDLITGTFNGETVIGQSGSHYNSFLTGEIDYSAIWNKALTQEEIQSYISCAPTGQEEGLVGYWNFNEGSGDTVYDISGNGNHGIINGAEFSEDVPESYNGCTDENALNFDAEALCDNGSCVYGDELVTSLEDENYNLEQDLSVFDTVEEEQDYSMSFDGTNFIETLYPGPSGTSPRTVSYWAKFFDNTYVGTFSYGSGSFGTDFLLQHNWTASGDEECFGPSFLMRGAGITYEDSTATDLNWHHFTFVLSGESNQNDAISIFVDGFELYNVCSDANYGASINTGSEHPINIGRCKPFHPEDPSMKGEIDNVIVWDYALSLNQIQSYMSCSPTGQEEGLVGYWNFNEGSGDTVYDISGNGNHGIIYGGAEFSEDVPESFPGCTDVNALNFDAEALCDNGSCVFADDVVSNLETENSNLEEELSVFETVEQEQDYSMSFDGVDDYIILSADSLPTGGRTISTWFNTQDDLSISRVLMSYGGGSCGTSFIIHFNNICSSGINTIEFQGHCNANVITYDHQNSIESNTWYYLTFTSNEFGSFIYLNGELIVESSVVSSNYVNGKDFIIGASISTGGTGFYTDGCSQPWLGYIDNSQIWNKPLSQEEIQSYMNCPPTGQEEGLVGYWNFNEGSGDTVYDISGNGNHGFINGAEFSEDVPESYDGCTDENALNFDESALCDNGSCVFGDEVVSNLEDSFNQTVSGLNNELDSTNSTLNYIIDTWQSSIDLTNATLDEVSQMNQTIASFTTLIDLQEGWNMIGYGCPEPVNIEQGMSMYTDLVLLIKDNNGSVYLPEFNFNGIGDFTPGYGYQLKVSEPIEDFGLCGDYTNTESPEITDIETDNAQMQNDINCLTGNPQIGDHCYGGIVFYVDESGEHGLVANINDIDGVYEEIGDNNGYLWGCFDGQSTDVPFNIISTEIGYGEYNTNEIIEYCQEENIAAKLADSFEDNTYSDWYLPSLGELSILCHVYSENSNKFNYDSRGFWTSSYNLSSYSPYFIDFYNSTSPGIYNLNCSEHFHPHNTIRGVIPIRSF